MDERYHLTGAATEALAEPVARDAQVIETRTATSASTDPSAVAPNYQYVWSAQSDAPILRDTIDPDTGLPTFSARIYYLTDADNNVTAAVRKFA